MGDGGWKQTADYSNKLKRIVILKPLRLKDIVAWVCILRGYEYGFNLLQLFQR